MEQLLCSGDVVRPHRINEAMAEAAGGHTTVQQALAERKIELAPAAPLPSGAKHKSKHGRKHKKGDASTLNLSAKGIALQLVPGSKADDKGKKDDRTSNKSDQFNADASQQQY